MWQKKLAMALNGSSPTGRLAASVPTWNPSIIWNVTFQTFPEPFFLSHESWSNIFSTFQVSTCLGALQVRFQGLSGMIIMCNAVVIGLETDLESNIWFWVEWLGALGSGPAASHVFFTLCLTHDMTTSDNRHALLAYFLFELVVRLLRHGCHFFRNEVPRIPLDSEGWVGYSSTRTWKKSRQLSHNNGLMMMLLLR